MPAIIFLWQGYCWIGKKTNKEINSVDGAYNLTKLYLKFLFVSGFNECLWAIFSLLSFENFWFYVWVVVVWVSKNLSAKTTKSIPNYWERSVKRKSNLNFIRVIKNSSFDQHFLYVWSKNFLVTISCYPLRTSPC